MPEEGTIPRTMTMWEFSWLVRREPPEDEYADWSKVLDETVERGYDALRIDAFPHLVARGLDGKMAERFTINPQVRAFMWGNHASIEVEPRRGLAKFMNLARDRGISVGLSSWFNDDRTHRSAEVVGPSDYHRIWHETLEFLEAEGLHDSIEWVDLCNEFPLGEWANGAHLEIFDANWRDPAAILGIWTDRQIDRINSYCDAIADLRREWPGLKFTFSIATLPPNVANIDTSAFGVAEPHLWISTTNPEFIERTRFIDFLSYLPDAVPRHVRLVDEVYWPDRERWLTGLRAAISIWADWARERDLPIQNTEGWASTVYDAHPTPSGRDPWDYIRDVGRAAVGYALEAGYEGICTSNFSQPHFPGLWGDLAWHRELNERIHAG